MTDSNTSQPKTMTDEETAEFAEQVFNVARQGDAVMLERLLKKAFLQTCATTRATPC